MIIILSAWLILDGTLDKSAGLIGWLFFFLGHSKEEMTWENGTEGPGICEEHYGFQDSYDHCEEFSLGLDRRLALPADSSPKLLLLRSGIRESLALCPLSAWPTTLQSRMSQLLWRKCGSPARLWAPAKGFRKDGKDLQYHLFRVPNLSAEADSTTRPQGTHFMLISLDLWGFLFSGDK